MELEKNFSKNELTDDEREEFQAMPDILMDAELAEKCYFCGEYTQGKYTYVIESPKDEFGIRVPVCNYCFEKIENY